MNGVAAARRIASPLIEGEYALGARNFEQIATFLRAQTGISLSEAKATMVFSRLSKRLRKLGLQSFDEYCAFIAAPDGTSERSEMLAALTTNVTRFFREPHHFEHLAKNVIPRLTEIARSGGRVRIWSAACSSGEEPYSIALTLLDAFPDAAKHDVRILATDINAHTIAKAKAAAYSDDAVTSIPPAMRERWLSCNREVMEKPWRVRGEVQALVTFKKLNLIGDWPMRGRFDVIFCRNVVIYFEKQTRTHLWGRLSDALAPDGRLYIGHSERIEIDGYTRDGLTVYRQTHGGGR